MCLNDSKSLSVIKLVIVLTSNKSGCLVYDKVSQINMAEHNENDPEQTLPLLTLNDIIPIDYSVTIGKNNPRVDLDKLRIPEDSCKIVKDILHVHPCKHLLDKSTSVLEFYLHQFWLTAKVILDDESFAVTLDRQVYTINHEVLRTVFLLP